MRVAPLETDKSDTRTKLELITRAGRVINLLFRVSATPNKKLYTAQIVTTENQVL